MAACTLGALCSYRYLHAPVPGLDGLFVHARFERKAVLSPLLFGSLWPLQIDCTRLTTEKLQGPEGCSKPDNATSVHKGACAFLCQNVFCLRGCSNCQQTDKESLFPLPGFSYQLRDLTKLILANTVRLEKVEEIVVFETR